MADARMGSTPRKGGIVPPTKASVSSVIVACIIVLFGGCAPAHSPEAPSTSWTGGTSVDPLTDATITTASTQVWDQTGSFFGEFTLTCTTSDGQAAFEANAVFFDRQSVGAPVFVAPRAGPQDLAILRVGDLEPVVLGLHYLSVQYSNELIVLGGRTGVQGGGDLQRYAMLARLPDANRLVLRPTLTTGEPVFTVALEGAPAVREVFANCAPVFQRYDELLREGQARIQVREEQAELYSRDRPAAENQAPVPPRREYFQQRAEQAEADCLQRHNVAGDALDNPVRELCAETGARWRQDFVSAARDYAFRIQILHSRQYGQDRWAAEGRAAVACGRQYEAASRGAGTPEAADAAAQAAVDCYVAAGNPPPER